MKRVVSLLICIFIVFAGMFAYAEDTEMSTYEKTNKSFTFYHFECLSDYFSEEYSENYPLLPLVGHGYGELAVYSTESRLYDFVFIPDDTGDAVWAIHIIGYRDEILSNNEADKLHVGYNHIIGLLYPFMFDSIMSGISTDTFGDEIMQAMASVTVKPEGTEFYSVPVRFADIADVQIYVNGDTFGIAIYFLEPVTYERIAESAYLLGD